MQFSTKLAAVLAAASFVLAAPHERRQAATVCSGSNTPQCCAVDVLGLADLQCANPPTTPTNQTQFIAECATIGQEARCCLLPILEQGLICSDPL
ncbi:hypothetical protein NA57DRAFT_31093 [Rhizodiscina lignyota]|uniref:Hydrophobin n=1 Tax=Rhizodiscina lignyota TaxID=1504668 RepID=A0A9P4IVF0_9PEZI|nr:hypothetical protein NA57DRAFT_31093 [Rhizodiscina lignyota]